MRTSQCPDVSVMTEQSSSGEKSSSHSSASSRRPCSPQHRAPWGCAGVWAWTNRTPPPLPHRPPVLSFSLPLLVLCPRWCRYWTWVMMLSSLLASIYQCQKGSRSVARVHVCVCVRGGVVTDEENGRGLQRMRSALEWEDGGKWDGNRKVLALHASVCLWATDTLLPDRIKALLFSICTSNYANEGG